MRNKLNLAIIEENKNQLSCMEALLGDSCIVTGYSTTEEALLKMPLDMPDVLIMDLDMPKVNGKALCDLLRDDDRFKEMPIVLISGSPTIGDFNLYFKGIDFMRKPIVGDELITKIRLYHNLHNAYSKTVRMYTEIKGT